jgi:hypothetical protein
MKVVWIPNLVENFGAKVAIYDDPTDEAPYRPQSIYDAPNEFGIVTYEDEEVGVLRILDFEETREFLANAVVRFEYFTSTMVQELAEQLKGVYGIEFINPKDRQNGGPTLENALKVAEKHGLLLGGYVVFPPRDDARITVDAVIIPPEKRFKELQEVLSELDFISTPDKYFDEDGNLVLWWD